MDRQTRKLTLNKETLKNITVKTNIRGGTDVTATFGNCTGTTNDCGTQNNCTHSGGCISVVYNPTIVINPGPIFPRPGTIVNPIPIPIPIGG